jgi:PAS domain S-box-containing protein
MGWQSTPYTVPLVLSVLVSLGLAGYVGRHLREEGLDRSLTAIFFLLLAAATWSLGYAIQLLRTDLNGKLLGITVANVGSVGVPAIWLVFTLVYADREKWLTRRRLGTLLGGSVAVLGIHLTNPIHHLFWTARVDWNGSFYVLERSLTTPYYVQLFTFIGMVVVGIYVLFRHILSQQDLYRGQAAALAFSPVLPLAANLKYVLAIGPHPGVDLTPIAFVGSGVALTYAIMRYRFLDVVPVARDVVVETMRDGYLVVDGTDTVVDTNAAARELLGVSDTVVGEPLEAVFPDAAALSSADGERQTDLVVERDGTSRYLDVRVTELSSQKPGRVIALRDVTDQRRAERRHRALIDHSWDLTVVLDDAGTVDYVSPSVERLLGFPPAEFEGRNAFDAVHEDDRETLREEFEQTRTDASYVARFEFRILDADGDVRAFEAIARNLLDNASVEGVVVNSWDVTDRKRRERDLRRTNERLEEFASLLSHDLRNPLAVARGNLQLAKEGELDALDSVENAHDRIDRLIDDVLALARNGQSVADTTTTDLETVATEAWSHVDTGDATLTVEGTHQFLSDRRRLVRLLENLFRNSVEHGSTGSRTESDDAVEHGSTSPPSHAQEDTVEHGSTGSRTESDEGLEIRVGVLGTEPTHGNGSTEAGFYVEDDGPGIPDADRERVFEYGYSSTGDGTGFGLAIVERIAEAHGWTVTTETGRDGGARFCIRGIDDRPSLVASK